MIWRNINTEWIHDWAWAQCRLRHSHDLARAARAIHAEIHGVGDPDANPWLVRDEMLEMLFYQSGTGSVNVPAWWYRQTEIGVLCHVLALREKLVKDETFTGQETQILCGMAGSSFRDYETQGKITPARRGMGAHGNTYRAKDVRAFDAWYREQKEKG